MNEVYLEMAPADCEQRNGRKCDATDCEIFVFNQPHMHMVPLEPHAWPWGVCSEDCAMVLVEELVLTIVPKPVAP